MFVAFAKRDIALCKIYITYIYKPIKHVQDEND